MDDGDSGDDREYLAREAFPQVFGAAALAFQGEHIDASRLLTSLSDDCFEAGMFVFGAVLASIRRSADLLGMGPVEYARDLAVFYRLGTGQGDL